MLNNISLVLITGFSIGILGGFHCIGMCGPIALSLPVHQYALPKRIYSVLLYNLGRALTYALLGLFIGLLGQGFELFKIQQYASIIAGVLILTILFFSSRTSVQIPFLSPFFIKVKSQLARLLKTEKSGSSFLAIGIVNGFLPCGLVYIAIAASVAAGSAIKSALLMFAFGLGTLPLMALTMFVGKYISLNIKNKLNKLSPYLIGIVAVLLILRGLNLGIPYISPKQEGAHKTCCHNS